MQKAARRFGPHQGRIEGDREVESELGLGDLPERRVHGTTQKQVQRLPGRIGQTVRVEAALVDLAAVSAGAQHLIRGRHPVRPKRFLDSDRLVHQEQGRVVELGQTERLGVLQAPDPHLGGQTLLGRVDCRRLRAVQAGLDAAGGQDARFDQRLHEAERRLLALYSEMIADGDDPLRRLR